MPATSNYAFRYPALGDDPNIPEDIQFLAEDVDGALAATDAEVAIVRALLTGYGAASFTANGTLGASTAVVAATVVIPDPGFPYLIRASGSYAWGFVGASVVDLVGIHINIDSTTYSTNELSRGFGRSVSAGAGASQTTLQASERTSFGFAPFTGSHTVRMHLRNWSSSQTATFVGTSAENSLEVSIVPA